MLITAGRTGAENHLDAYTLNNQFKNDTMLFNYNTSFLFDSLAVPFTINYTAHRTENMTVFTVYKAFDTQQENGLWYIKLDTAKNVKLSTCRIGSISNKIKYSDTTQTKPIINTLTQSWRNVNIDTTISKILLGGTDSLSFYGKMAEYIVFNKTLTKNDIQKVQSYLAIKYGITLFQSNYINSTDSIIWNYSDNIAYANEIAGIGKDTLFGLNQKQSAAYGGDDILKIGAGNIFTTNTQNQTQLEEGNFLVWGNNGKALKSKENDTIASSSINNLLEKKWMMQVSGNNAMSIATQVIFDASKIDSSGKCVLLINRDASGNFTMNNTEIYVADSIDINKKAYFSNIYWDTDHSGKDMFTFLVGNKLTLLARAKNASSATSNNGLIKLEVLGGKPPYNYSLLADSTQHLSLWNSSDSLQSIYNLAPGKYLAKVLDIKGLTDAKLVEILVSSNNLSYSSYHPQNNNNNNTANTITENRFDIYPNPCKGDYTIYAQVYESIDVAVRVLDMGGKLIEETQINGQGQFVINGKLKQKGNYLIEIETNKEKKTFKLLVD